MLDCMFYPLETMHLQLIVLHETTLDQHLTDFLPLVSLKLNNLAILRMLNHSSIAGKLLLGNFHDFLEVILCRESLDSGEGFPSVSLLNSDMHHSLLTGLLITLAGISKRVKGLQVVQLRHGGFQSGNLDLLRSVIKLCKL